jgi:hypothetical protein
MSKLDNILHKAHLAYQKAEGIDVSSDGRSKGSKFVEPSSETWIRQHRTWHPARYYTFHCAHDRSRFVACATCGRSLSHAKELFAKFMKTGQL